VRLVADKMEAADEWQGNGAWREAAACVGEEVEEVDGEEGGDEPWQPRKKQKHCTVLYGTYTPTSGIVCVAIIRGGEYDLYIWRLGSYISTSSRREYTAGRPQRRHVFVPCTVHVSIIDILL
jgi:hypothetical protein